MFEPIGKRGKDSEVCRFADWVPGVKRAKQLVPILISCASAGPIQRLACRRCKIGQIHRFHQKAGNTDFACSVRIDDFALASARNDWQVGMLA